MTAGSLQEMVDGLSHQEMHSGMALPFMPYRTTAFDQVSERLQRSDSEQAKLNCLYVMFRLARESCPEKFGDLLKFAVTFMDDASIQVRSYAAVTTIRIADLISHRLIQPDPNLERSYLQDQVRGVLAQGACPETLDLIEAFLQSEV